jgi:putative MATE family efflux protein
MKDLTQGPIYKHIFAMAMPIAIGMLLQTMYYIVDLYFVARLGEAAIAGVSAAGNVMFIVFALVQMVSVGVVALISHAVGRKDKADANHIFNQSVALSAACALVTFVAGYALASPYMELLAADAATRDNGVIYLYWFLPGLGLQFALVAMGSALRGTGIAKPGMVVQMLTVLLNIILAPILIAGWGTGHPMGVAGAALASSLSIAAGVAMMSFYFLKLEHYVSFDSAHWKPQIKTWLRMLNIGLPAGGEFALMSVFMGTVYWIIRDFGPAAQAGFGIGMRITQAIFLPAMAIAFAVPAIAGQNFGAKNSTRVRETFFAAAVSSSILMAVLTLLCQWLGQSLIRFFTSDAEVIRVGNQYLQIVSWNFVAVGLVFTCSGMFQAMGNTWPSLLSTASRLVVFFVIAVWVSKQPGFELHQVWYVSVGTTTLQAVISLLLVRVQLRKRLQFGGAPAAAQA